ncbi:MAG: hypothetical protein RL571_2311 [Pseudomonadota bacterium]|jgi:hypothetical protein
MSHIHRTLLLSNTQLIALHIEQGQLIEEACFGLDDMGKEAFLIYLEQRKEFVFSLLVDVVEEDFQLESTPHLSKADRRALLMRRLEQNYRTTPYRRFIVQKEGKKGEQDQVLLSALSPAAPIDAVVNALLEKKVVLQGIYSVALLAGEMMHRSGLGLAHYLLISFSSDGGMRQTYLSAEGLKFSRVSSLPEGIDLQDAVRMAEVIVLESLRARQYLSTLRMLGRDDKVQLAVVAPHGLDCQAAISQRLQASGDAGHFTISDVPLGLLAQKLRLPAGDSLLSILCSWLMLRPPANHYGQAKHLIHSTWQKWGRLLRYGAFVGLFFVLIWSGLAMQDASDVQASNNQSLKKTAQIDERLRRFNLLLKQSNASDPAAMKGVHELYNQHLLTWPDIELTLQQVSQVLLEFPELSLDELRWRSGRAPVEPAAQASAEVPAEVAQQPVVLELQGRVEPFSQQYRQALNSVNRLSSRLSALPNVKVETLQLPLNISSTARVEGQVLADADDDKRVDFVLRLSWGPKAP